MDPQVEEQLREESRKYRQDIILLYAFLMERRPDIQRYVRWHIWDVRAQYFLHRKQWKKLVARIFDIPSHTHMRLPRFISMAWAFRIPNAGTSSRVCYTFDRDHEGHEAYQESLKNL